MTMIDFLKKNLLFLAMATFVLVATFTLSLAKPELLKFVKNVSVVSPLPVLGKAHSFPLVSAQGAVAIDLDSAVVLYEKNADTPFLPASTTKIMTAIVAMEHYSRQEVIEVSAIKVEGQKMGLVAGERITFENLLYGLLIYSANDAAEVLAQSYPGGKVAFVGAMNKKAEDLHLENTHFANPTGLDGEGHFSTARDMVRLATFGMKSAEFAEIVNLKEVVVKSVDEKYSHHLLTTNKLLDKVNGVRGVKTGWTEAARENLVSFTERDGKKVLIALLASQDRFGETEELIDWIFSSYDWRDVSYHTQ